MLKFTLSEPKKAPKAYAPKLYTAELLVADAYESLVAQGEKVRDLTDIVENIHQVTVAINKHGIKGLEVLGTMTEGSLESFIGAESMADAKLASAALEGSFSDAMKNAWAAIKEWFARLYDWIRKFFFSLEADVKHLEGMVAPANDAKFNPNTKYEDPFPTKDALAALLRASAVAGEEFSKVMPTVEQAYTKLASLDFSKLAAGDIEGSGIKDEGFEKISQELLSKYEQLAKDLEQKLETDPVCAKMQELVNNVAEAKDPIAIMQAINANFVKSGSAADLGYKTGADIRGVVMDFAKIVRLQAANEKPIQNIMNAVTKVADQAGKLAEGMGVPQDFIKLGKNYLGLISKVQKLNSKLTRYVLMFVTRAVRRMYNNAPNNSVQKPAAAPAAGAGEQK